MAGANYIGGKRHAALSRKDRLHKSHFSRQRLGILTNGLIPRKPNSFPSVQRMSGIRDISLHQAKANLGTTVGKPRTITPSYVEPPAGRSTPRAHSPNLVRYSKVLEVLDTSERASDSVLVDVVIL